MKITDEMVKVALTAPAGSWRVIDLFQDADEAPEIMREALEAVAPLLRSVPDGWRFYPVGRAGVGYTRGNFSMNWSIEPPEVMAAEFFKLCKAMLAAAKGEE